MKKSPEAECDFNINITGSSLHKVVLNASTIFVIGGITHDIPVIVHSCIESLIRKRYLPKWTVSYHAKKIGCDEDNEGARKVCLSGNDVKVGNNGRRMKVRKEVGRIGCR